MKFNLRINCNLGLKKETFFKRGFSKRTNNNLVSQDWIWNERGISWDNKTPQTHKHTTIMSKYWNTQQRIRTRVLNRYSKIQKKHSKLLGIRVTYNKESRNFLLSSFKFLYQFFIFWFSGVFVISFFDFYIFLII